MSDYESSPQEAWFELPCERGEDTFVTMWTSSIETLVRQMGQGEDVAQAGEGQSGHSVIILLLRSWSYPARRGV